MAPLGIKEPWISLMNLPVTKAFLSYLENKKRFCGNESKINFQSLFLYTTLSFFFVWEIRVNMIGNGTLEILCVIFSIQSVCIVHILLKGHQEYNCSFGLTRNVRNRIGFYLASLLCENKVIVITGLFCAGYVNQWGKLKTIHGNSISHFYILGRLASV